MAETQIQKNMQRKARRDPHLPTHFKLSFMAFIKRTLDILVSAFGLLLLSPVFGLVAIGIKRDSDGPVFYRAKRIGRHGKPFEMLKFRTMYETPESYNGPPITGNDDGRITAYGQWLRDTKLNELPQLWNVLVGEMSLVGPRPECPDFVEKWPGEVSEKVLSMRPGITSPASVIYRDEEKQLNGHNYLDNYLKEIMPDKLRLDMLYIDNHSLATDLDVIFMTLIAILPRIGKAKIKEKTLLAGPLYKFSSQFLVWFLIDLMVAFIAVGIAGVVWRSTQPLDLGIGRAMLLALIIAVLLSLINTLLGLSRLVWRYASPALVIDIGLSVLITSVIIFLGNRLWLNSFLLPPYFILNYSLLTFIGLVAVRYRERLLTGVANRWMSIRDHKTLGERVLVVGAGDGGELAVWLILKSEYASAFSIIGFVDDDYRKQKMQVAGYPVLGTTNDIPYLAKKFDVGLMLYSISKITQHDRKRILALCQQTGAQVIVIPDVMEILKTPLEKSFSEVQK